MARKTLPLTDTQIKAAKPRDKDYSLFDGGGMYLLIKANNSKIWRFKYTRPYTKKGGINKFWQLPRSFTIASKKAKR